MPLLKNNTLALLALAASLPALAQTAPPAPPTTPASEQVIVPQVDRRDIQLPRYASNDFSVSLFAGTYATPNFGSSAVTGVRLGYHVTEDIFVEGSYGKSKVSDKAFAQIFPNGGVLPAREVDLSYYNVMAGYNVLPGEVFFGRNNAKISQGYIAAGVGSTTFGTQKRQTVVAGFGLRVIFNRWFSMQADVRDHIYSLDILGKLQSTQNLEISAGISVFF
jgi:outer membrane beta-barrel protein